MANSDGLDDSLFGESVWNTLDVDQQLGFCDDSIFNLTDSLDFTLPDSINNSSFQPHSGASRRRGRLYTGCLTCRQRKIKCDERRPFCNNCEKSRRYQCHGYADSAPDTASADHRHGNNYRVSRPSQQHSRRRDLARIAEYTSGQDQALPENPSYAQDGNTPLEPILDEIDIGSREESSNAIGTTRTQQHFDTSQDEQETLLLKHYRDVVCHYMMPVVDGRRNPWFRLFLPLALSLPSTDSQLALRHALSAAAAYHKAETEDGDVTLNIQRAERYREMASAALRRMPQEEQVADLSDLEKLSLFATAMALLSTSVFGAERTDCSMYICLAKTVVNRTGGSQFWLSTTTTRSLLQILRCYDVLTSTTCFSLEGQRECDRLETICSGSETDPEAENIQSSERTEHASSFEDPASNIFDLDDHYILGLSFGVTRQTFSLLRRTVRLSNMIGSCSDPLEWPPHIRETAVKLRNDLTLFRSNPPSTNELLLLEACGLSPESAATFLQTSIEELPPIISSEIIKNHQQSFHFAVLIYFYRVTYTSSAWPTMGQESAEVDCQDYVRKTLDSLENIECFTRDVKTQAANTFWPAFIAAVEAVEVGLRHRAFIWMSRAAKRGFGNVTRAQKVVMETWRRVDRWRDDEPLRRGLGPVDWRQVMKDTSCMIILT